MERKKWDAGGKSNLNERKIELLEFYGFVWAQNWKGETGWGVRFHELLQFKKRHGHCDVPTKSKLNRALGRWVSSQRAMYRSYVKGADGRSLTKTAMANRINRLREIGFRFSLLPDEDDYCSNVDSEEGTGTEEEDEGGGGEEEEEESRSWYTAATRTTTEVASLADGSSSPSPSGEDIPVKSELSCPRIFESQPSTSSCVLDSDAGDSSVPPQQLPGAIPPFKKLGVLPSLKKEPGEVADTTSTSQLPSNDERGGDDHGDEGTIVSRSTMPPDIEGERNNGNDHRDDDETGVITTSGEAVVVNNGEPVVVREDQGNESYRDTDKVASTVTSIVTTKSSSSSSSTTTTAAASSSSASSGPMPSRSRPRRKAAVKAIDIVSKAVGSESSYRKRTLEDQQ
jgi:hypothetical protein